MIGNGNGWRPGRSEQRLLWWSRLLLRWVGTVGVIFSVLIQPNALDAILFTVIGSGVDVGTLAATLIRIGHEERKALERSMDEDSPDPSPRLPR